MQKRSLDITSELGLFFFKKSVFLKSILFLAFFLVLEEIYMRALEIDVPVTFLKFMLSEPLILGSDECYYYRSNPRRVYF